MSRARTLERRREREQQKRRQRQITIVGVIIGAAVLLALLFVVANQPAEAPIPAESEARYKDLPQSQTDDGFPVLGKADAPVKVLEYSSFDCPHCREFHETVTPRILDRVRSGQVQFTYVPMFGTGGITNGEGAAKAAICAGEQNAFWKFHDALFTWQGLYANQAFSSNRLGTGIGNLGIDRGRWDQCIGSSLPTDVINAALKAAQLQNISGTPSIVVNGSIVSPPDWATIGKAIDDAVAQSGKPVTPITEATPEATPKVEATQEQTPEATAETTQAATVEATTEATAEGTAKP
jgi:protein-disulfide isomerase